TVFASPAKASFSSSTSITCQSVILLVNGSTPCSITVSNAEPSLPPMGPMGHVELTVSSGTGVFTPESPCSLVAISPSASTCDVSFRPSTVGEPTIKAHFLGGGGYGGSENSVAIKVVPQFTSFTLISCGTQTPVVVPINQNLFCKVSVSHIPNEQP